MVRGVILFVVLPMAALDLPVMPWCVRFDQLMMDAELCQGLLKERQLRLFCAHKAIGEFRTIVWR